jgi:hypothetical protein
MYFLFYHLLYEGHVEVARLLLSNRASVNEKNISEMTALMLSAFGGQCIIIVELYYVHIFNVLCLYKRICIIFY